MKIKQLQLSKALFVPSGQNMPKTIFDGSQSRPGIRMELTDRGALCEYQGSTFLIPMHIIECVVVEKEASSAKTVQKSSK